MRYRNVIVFGDSLSDIGTMVGTLLGGILSHVRPIMTVSPAGRFSDCRNWTDYMYTDASQSSLLKGSADASRTASKPHLRLTKDSLVTIPNGKHFYYANYAQGGACGDIPADKGKRLALGTFKEQVERFKSDWNSLYNSKKGVDNHPEDRTALIFVWFGANDLFTANCTADSMASVAKKIADKRRNEISQIIGGSTNSRKFIFMGLVEPRNVARFNSWQRKGKNDFDATDSKGAMANLQRGVSLFNTRMGQHTLLNGDTFVDMAKEMDGAKVTEIVTTLGLEDPMQRQKKSVNSHHWSATEYDGMLGGRTPQGFEKNPAKFAVTSDKVHPTDIVYKQIWQLIRTKLISQGCGFGHFNT